MLQARETQEKGMLPERRGCGEIEPELERHPEKVVASVLDEFGLVDAQADPAQLAKALVGDLAERGIQSSEATLAQLRQGCGESVCLILNELINQELMGRDFHFESPDWQQLTPPDVQHDAAEVDEESDLEAQVGQDSAEATEESDEDDRRERVDCHGLGSHRRSESCFEPVHEAPVTDLGRWQEEVSRVRPLLRLDPRDDIWSEGWRLAVRKASELCRQVQSSGVCSVFPQAASGYAERRHEDLRRLMDGEARLNSVPSLREKAEDLRRVQASEEQASAQIADLQLSVASLSVSLAALATDAEAAQAELATRDEELHDPAQLSRLRTAAQRLKAEGRQLEVRTRCMQSDLLRCRHML